MTPEIATAIILALGGASIIPKLIEGLKAWQSGRAKEEKESNRTALGQLISERERANGEAEYARLVERFAAQLERMLIQMGVPVDKLPAWPARKVDAP